MILSRDGQKSIYKPKFIGKYDLCDYAVHKSPTNHHGILQWFIPFINAVHGPVSQHPRQWLGTLLKPCCCGNAARHCAQKDEAGKQKGSLIWLASISASIFWVHAYLLCWVSQVFTNFLLCFLFPQKCMCLPELGNAEAGISSLLKIRVLILNFSNT